MKTDDFLFCRHDEGCNGHSTPSNASQPHPAKYRCLLKCEGEKTYIHPGFCPDCNSKMVLADEGREPVNIPDTDNLSFTYCDGKDYD